jgi:hypothetical protein
LMASESSALLVLSMLMEKKLAKTISIGQVSISDLPARIYPSIL